MLLKLILDIDINGSCGGTPPSPLIGLFPLHIQARKVTFIAKSLTHHL